MIHFVGAGPGAVDLITIRGLRLLQEADLVIYAGSLINPELLNFARQGCRLEDSAKLTLEQVIALMREAESTGEKTVRLHSGDPSVYGAIKEQMDALTALGISFDVTPGVSSFSAAAAALPVEYTLPGVSQTLILSRIAGRTPVPEKEKLSSLAAHDCSLALFLSAGMLDAVREELIAGGMDPDTPAALVYKATWPDEKVVRCTVETLPAAGEKAGINRTALVLAGHFLESGYQRSKLYDPTFTTGYRQGEIGE